MRGVSKNSKRERKSTKKARADETNYILAYYQKIKDGTILAGRWIHLIFEYIIKGLEDGLFFFDVRKANAPIEWIEAHTFHTKGPRAPGNFTLELWQKAIVSAMFGIVDANGLRQFREVVWIMARKNGKSLFASAIARYVWTHDGYGTDVFILAPKLEQADIIYSNVWLITQLDPDYIEKKRLSEIRDEHNKRIYDQEDMEQVRRSDLYLRSTNSTVKKVAFSSKKSDGFSPSLCVCDEIASFEGDKGLKQYEVMKSGQGARSEPILLSCSTSGYVNESIYDELIKRATAFLLGNSKETRLLPFLYMIDDVEKWNDINELRKSNPNLGVSVSVDYLLEEIRIAEGSLSKRREFLTKYCNIKQSSSMAWIPAHIIEKASGPALSLKKFRNCYAVTGIDLSQTTDLTAAVVVIEKKKELYVFAHFWMPAARIDDATARDNVPYSAYVQRGFLSLSGDNFVDYQDVYRWMVQLIEKAKIYPLKNGYDRYSSQYLVQDLKKYGFHMDDVFQGENLYGVMQETQGLFADGKIHIGDNDLLKMHLLNSALKMSLERGRGKLVKISQNARIDGTAALLDAMTVRQKWYGEIGSQLKN